MSMKPEEINWLPEKEVKKLAFFKEEIYTQFKDVFDLLNDTDKLEAFLALLSEEKRDKLYAHPIISEYDLLP